MIIKFVNIITTNTNNHKISDDPTTIQNIITYNRKSF